MGSGCALESCEALGLIPGIEIEWVDNLGRRLEVLCGEKPRKQHQGVGLGSQLCRWPVAGPRAGPGASGENLMTVSMEMETNRSSPLVTYLGV